MNDSLWSGLLDDFRKLRDLQKGDDLRSVLIEFSTPELIARGERVIPSKYYPKEWVMTQVLIEERTVRDPRPESQRIYKQLVIPYRDSHQILQDDENGPPLPERLRIIKKRLTDSIELAGKEILNHSGATALPDEIAGLNSNISAWLLFLHFIGKPDRKTWRRVNVISLFEKVFMGSLPPEDVEQERKPNTETFDIVGQFSFEPLAENSYSELKDITAASIEAINRIKDGLLSSDREETTSVMVTIAMVKHFVQKERKRKEPYSTGYMSSRVREWGKADIERRGSRPGEWSFERIKPILKKQFKEVDWDKF